MVVVEAEVEAKIVVSFVLGLLVPRERLRFGFAGVDRQINQIGLNLMMAHRVEVNRVLRVWVEEVNLNSWLLEDLQLSFDLTGVSQPLEMALIITITATLEVLADSLMLGKLLLLGVLIPQVTCQP